MPRKPVIAVVGTGRDNEAAVSNARKLGQMIAERGWILITGGRNAGVMKAANEGAKSAKDSLTIGILPTRDSDISPAVDVSIITDTGEARNNIITLSADIVIACDVDDPGTASEVALALKNGKYVVLLGANEPAKKFFAAIGINRIHIADSASESIDLADNLIHGV